MKKKSGWWGGLDMEQAPPHLCEALAGMSPSERYRFAQSWPGSTELWRHREEAAEYLLEVTALDHLLPGISDELRRAVRDGILLFFNRTSRERFLDFMVDQALLPSDTTAPRRALELAKKSPLLQKVAQTVARHPDVAEDFRELLVHAEDNLQRTNPARLLPAFREEYESFGQSEGVVLGEELLSEGSVAAVVEYRCRGLEGVIKFIKPSARSALDEELLICGELAGFFDAHRWNYPLSNLRIVETFQEVEKALRGELDLTGEQIHLQVARDVYASCPNVIIPEVLPQSCSVATAMTRAPGCRLADASLSGPGMRHLARALIDVIIARPLMAPRTNAIFHGDPHAGNLFYDGGEDGCGRIGLLDWSLAGSLTGRERAVLSRMGLSLASGDGRSVCELLVSLSRIEPEEDALEVVKQLVDDVCGRTWLSPGAVFGAMLDLLDRTAFEGLDFSGDLLLFRRSFLTLKGVVYHLAPDVTWESALGDVMVRRLVNEIPQRWLYAWMPWWDRPSRYPSHISNADLGRLLTRFWMKGSEQVRDLIFANAKI